MRVKLIVLIFHILQCVFTALQNKQIKGNIIFGRRFIELFKQRLGKTHRPCYIRALKLVIYLKHFYHQYNIMLIFGYIYITIYGCKNIVYNI